MDESVFYDFFRIKATETDASKRIKIPNLINYMQEGAWMNASKLGFSTYDMLDLGITWVLNRMHIEFFELPTYPQTIKVETWPSDLDKYFAYRDFRVFDQADQVLAQATSSWLILDINTRKLIAVPEHIKNARFTVERNGMEKVKVKGKSTYDENLTESEFSCAVSWFDLDVNNHVNNTKYFQWMLDSLDRELFDMQTPKSIDITFKSEATYKDLIVSQSYKIEGNCYAHQIFNESTGKVLIVGKSEFKDC
jgi:medium-chain acyl-[acyl-carrier-protein] hydrolase